MCDEAKYMPALTTQAEYFRAALHECNRIPGTLGAHRPEFLIAMLQNIAGTQYALKHNSYGAEVVKARFSDGSKFSSYDD